MHYLPPFASLKHLFEFRSTNGTIMVSAPYEVLQQVVQSLLQSVHMDEAWYLASYPDVAEAIAQGTFLNARQHFVKCGYFEGRLPTPLEVDEDWYLTTYPDVAKAISAGKIESALHHFQACGYMEGRQPAPI